MSSKIAQSTAQAAQKQKVRRIIMTVSVAAITATGAWYGAGLKIKQDAKKVSDFLWSGEKGVGQDTVQIGGGCVREPENAGVEGLVKHEGLLLLI